MHYSFLQHLCDVANETLTRPVPVPVAPRTAKAMLFRAAVDQNDPAAARALRILNGAQIFLTAEAAEVAGTLVAAATEAIAPYLDEHGTPKDVAAQILDFMAQTLQDAALGVGAANAAGRAGL